MKTKFTHTLFLLFFVVVTRAQQQPAAPATTTDLPKGATSDWFTNASRFIREMEYDIYPSSTKDNFRTINSANRIRFVIDAGGYDVHSIQQTTQSASWQASFRIEGVHKGHLANRTTAFVVVKSKNAITYRSCAYDVQYINSVEGMRQNFIINQQPEGDRPLSVIMQLQSDLSVSLSGNTLIFHDKQDRKNVKLIYEDLKVWDAANRILPAEMQYDKKSGKLMIVVDDKNAVYPITIDPLNKTPEWTTSADGILPGLLTNLQLQVQTLYGYTVTGLGDINGDGFDDVSVSAPAIAVVG